MYLFVLRFYGPGKPLASCRAQSVYLTTLFLGRLLFVLRFYGRVNLLVSSRTVHPTEPPRPAVLGRLSPPSG